MQNRIFWNTQPVLLESYNENETKEGLIIENRCIGTEYETQLPNGLTWKIINPLDQRDTDLVFNLLRDHYVEDEGSRFRFYYSKEFLSWSISSPTNNGKFSIGIESSSELIGFISGVPLTLSIKDKKCKFLSMNFLCVHKSYRKLRLTPILLQKMIQTTIHEGYPCGIYTSGTLIHTPISTSHYYLRYLNLKNLEKAGFVVFDRTLGPTYREKIYSLPDLPIEKKSRPMTFHDLPQVFEFFINFISKYSVYQNFTIEEFSHLFLSNNKSVYSFVYETSDGIKDFFSFYVLCFQPLNGQNNQYVTAAYCYYYAYNCLSIDEIFWNMLHWAKDVGADIFYMIDVMDNKMIKSDLKFESGQGSLYYFLYNWSLGTVNPESIGVILV
ncbi:hypothetical protein SteCoe_11868 [Stentor coeruleus]|uniref:Glycylpeptide N-tetradecanoyltransferase n=1 Tax=Stentor coeruleus TaxID=5963 RepID=A0A1R2CC75_9CILI|nr:hypothetical protein SteCoe_11868 [Stentor coeruleus]